MDNVIEVSNVSKIYKVYNKSSDRFKEAMNIKRKKYHSNFTALKNINFCVERGQIYGIMGINGSGKSTLLKIITGILTPNTGTVYVDGKLSALLELGTGFNFEYTGIENIYLSGAMMGFSREEIEARVEDICEFADIGDFINSPLKIYSSGMFSRLAFAVAINVDPDILIVDEALSVGDYFFQSKCYKKFEEFKKSGKTIVFVTHDMSSILKYCDKVLLLNKGEMVEEGEADYIINIYKRYIASNSMNSEISKFEGKNKSSINNIKKQNLLQNPNVLEYGTRQAEIIDFAVINEEGIITSTVLKNKEFTVYLKVKFNSDIQNPIFAFTIKDIKGTELIGTNTLLEKTTIKSPKSGDIVEIEFTQKMYLQGGNYLLSLGVTAYETDKLEVFHRLYDVVGINCISEKNTIGYYDCNSRVTIKQ